jgi:HEAT repeat protein
MAPEWEKRKTPPEWRGRRADGCSDRAISSPLPGWRWHLGGVPPGCRALRRARTLRASLDTYAKTIRDAFESVKCLIVARSLATEDSRCGYLAGLGHGTPRLESRRSQGRPPSRIPDSRGLHVMLDQKLFGVSPSRQPISVRSISIVHKGLHFPKVTKTTVNCTWQSGRASYARRDLSHACQEYAALWRSNEPRAPQMIVPHRHPSTGQSSRALTQLERILGQLISILPKSAFRKLAHRPGRNSPHISPSPMNRRDTKITEAAIRILAHRRDRRAVMPLIQLLKSDPFPLPMAAATALGEIRDPAAIKPHMKFLWSNLRRLRMATATALGEIRDPAAIKPLIKAFTDYPNVRTAAVHALARYGACCVPPLLRASRNSSFRMRGGAVLALGHLKRQSLLPLLIVHLKDRCQFVRSSASDAIVALGPNVARPMMAFLETGSVWSREGIFRALEEFRAIDLLIPALGHPEGSVRGASSKVLGNLRSRRAVLPLLALLQDTERNVRWEAIRALGQIGDKRAVRPLILLLEHDDTVTRSSAAWALGALGDQQAVDPLLKLLSDPPPLGHHLIVGALRRLKSSEAIPTLRPGAVDAVHTLEHPGITPRAPDSI